MHALLLALAKRVQRGPRAVHAVACTLQLAGQRTRGRVQALERSTAIGGGDVQRHALVAAVLGAQNNTVGAQDCLAVLVAELKSRIVLWAHGRRHSRLCCPCCWCLCRCCCLQVDLQVKLLYSVVFGAFGLAVEAHSELAHVLAAVQAAVRGRVCLVAKLAQTRPQAPALGDPPASLRALVLQLHYHVLRGAVLGQLGHVGDAEHLVVERHLISRISRSMQLRQ